MPKRALRPQALTLAAVVALAGIAVSPPLSSQPRFGSRPRTGVPENLPSEPTAVALPSVSAEITGPGPMFDSAPSQAYMSVGLYHLFRWVDAGISPPHAERILLDRDVTNDGSQMALDEHGNPRGGIRNPYVDVPVAKYGAVIAAADPPIAHPAAWIAANGPFGAALMCRLSAYEEAYSKAELRELYGSKREYLRRFEARLDELERAGWSLPVYHDLILADARAADF